MATFDFPFHRFTTEYPDSGFRLKLGGSYQFSAPPVAPDQRIFKLKFALMQYYVNPNGTLDLAKNPQYNMGVLEAFYQLHKLHATFIYPHPVYGDLVCSFSKPLAVPATGDFGIVRDVDIELVERPGMTVSAGTDLYQIEYQNLP